jgi:hypothetical protein
VEGDMDMREDQGHMGEEAECVFENACKKLVHDMHYEVCIQAVVNYYHEHESTKLVKPVARTKTLTKEQYMKVEYIHGCKSHIKMLNLFSMYFDVTN